jgi:hypothetical protein
LLALAFEGGPENGYDTLLTGTVFAKTRQPPATLVLLLSGIAKGEPMARLACELRLSRKQLHTLRQRIHANINETAPTAAMPGTAFEADELYQNAYVCCLDRRERADRQHAAQYPRVGTRC